MNCWGEAKEGLREEKPGRGKQHHAQFQKNSSFYQHLIVPTQEDFVYEDMEALCGSLRTLATDSNKYRAKIDRRRQRSIFRAVLHFVEVCVRT